MMDIAGNWVRIKAHRHRLADREVLGLASTLFQGQEAWLAERLWSPEDEGLAIEFLGCLAQNGSAKALNLLLAQLEAGEGGRHLAAVTALKDCPPELTMEALVQILLRQNQSAVKAGEILLSYGEQGVRILWRLWFGEDRPDGLKAQILELLAGASASRSEDLAFLAFLSEEEALLRAALKAAELLEARKLWGNVTCCLQHPSWRLRGRAVLLLAHWREERALPYLDQMGEDPEPWVEKERQKALRLLTAGHGDKNA